MKKRSKKSAFSLVELSIVLVILGLLVGGVLSGRSLIKAAELRSVTRDFQKYHAAMMTFKDKYFYYPGDMPNAAQFWGVAGGDGTLLDSLCQQAISTDSKTCSGDGNGVIMHWEGYRAWQHLANAGLIEGLYTGTKDFPPGITPTYYTRGLNIPASRLPNAAFILGAAPPWAQGVYFGVATLPSTVSYNGLHIDVIRPLITSGGSPISTASMPFLGALSHEEAWNLDTKMDDGVASTGRIRADFIRLGPGWVAITDATCQTYDPTNTTNTCALAYIFGQ